MTPSLMPLTANIKVFKAWAQLLIRGLPFFLRGRKSHALPPLRDTGTITCRTLPRLYKGFLRPSPSSVLTPTPLEAVVPVAHKTGRLLISLAFWPAPITHVNNSSSPRLKFFLRTLPLLGRTGTPITETKRA